MTIFALHQNVLADYRDFVCSFLLIADDRARQFVNRCLDEEAHLWPDPLVQLSPAYATGATVDELAQLGLISPQTARIFRTPAGRPFRLYQHQEEAIQKALQGESMVVTSGTGSGKSLCYFLPIIDRLIRKPETGERVAALVVYPMNALVNSQYQALLSLQERYEQRTGTPFPVTFAKYTGETRDAEREQLRRRPPQILLTNYVMGELLLVRPDDQRFLDRIGGGLRFLVFDELHTYRGRQGADVALLVRRLQERCAAPDLVHIGTSATMVASPEATPEERRETVAEFASRFFGQPFRADQIIEETLAPLTEGGLPSQLELATALSQPLPEDPEAFRRHALVRWLEYELGVELEAEGRLKRRLPLTLPAAAQRLAEQTGVDKLTCEAKLREAMTVGASLGQENGAGLLAFKLHQFIGQGRALYATLEGAQIREFSIAGHLRAPGGRVLAPLKFCRQCGQDYYHVLRGHEGFLPHPVGVQVDEAEEEVAAGYLMLATAEGDWSEEQLPEEWYDAKGRLKPTWRPRVPQPVWVRPDGTCATRPGNGAQKMWWQPAPFTLCLNCGEFYTAREREFSKLATLSSEARTSATTVLATSLLRHAGRTGSARDKLLTFTDNRQDASLQAGHFNDFIQVALLRSSLYHALQQEPELPFERLASAVVAACGLTIGDIARNPQLDPASTAAQEVWQAFTDLTEYRLYEDLRRGWRVVQPNLEHVGLLRLDYRGLAELSRQDHFWSFQPVLAEMTPAEREILLRAVLDQFRRKLAIHCRVLQETFQQQLRRRAEQHLNEFWGVDPEVKELRPAPCFTRLGRAPRRAQDFSLGPRSALGRWLRARLNLTGEDYWGFLDRFLDFLVRQGFLIRLQPDADHQPYQLDAARLLWRLGDGSPPPPGSNLYASDCDSRLCRGNHPGEFLLSTLLPNGSCHSRSP